MYVQDTYTHAPPTYRERIHLYIHPHGYTHTNTPGTRTQTHTHTLGTRTQTHTHQAHAHTHTPGTRTQTHTNTHTETHTPGTHIHTHTLHCTAGGQAP